MSAPHGTPSDAADFRQLPEPVRLEDTVTSLEVESAPDPTMGRDAETEWLLRNAAG